MTLYSDPSVSEGRFLFWFWIAHEPHDATAGDPGQMVRLDEVAAELPGEESVSAVPGSLLLPPVPVGTGENWPLLSITRGMFKRDANAGAFDDPLVGGIDHILEVRIGEHPIR